MARLLDEEFLRKIDRLTLVSKRVRVGSLKGERRSLKRGTSVEFADYRNYTPGDDLRQVDWNIYARLEKVFLKLFEEEEELTLHLLLDCSRSMDWSGAPEVFTEMGGATGGSTGGPHLNKLLYSKKTTAALAYMALAAMDRVTISGLNAKGGTNEPRLPLTRGKNQTLRVIRFVEDLSSGAGTNLNATLRAYANQTRHPGLLFLISDLFAPEGCFEGLKALQAAGHEITLLHVLSPDEVNPTLRGDFKLVDSETGESQDVSINQKALDLYRQEFQAWQHELVEFSQRRAINYIHVETSTPFEDLVLHYLRRRGLVT
ncbi:MAG: DUF58 domain-containing protein [Chloroflexi bacterium]|nr:DUF58 domain-containing protein [Chloroflexota bacterium]